ncbi:MAG: hypothetical protein NC548_41500 [Lachnospiraceae bacterium]|nr:hypothetical protein [Lachnospiraceae bacterium]
MGNRLRDLLLLVGSMVLVCMFASSQEKQVRDGGLCREGTERESITDEPEKEVEEHMKEAADTQQEPFWDDIFWYYEVRDRAVEVAEEHGLYQFLYLNRTWISEEGYHCAYFNAEDSDSGVYVEAQSMEEYRLAFTGSIFTEGFAGMDYRIIDVDEQKVPLIEEIILQNGINERCTLHGMADMCALISTASGTWYSVDMAGKAMSPAEAVEGRAEDETDWDFHGAWGDAYRGILNNWIRVLEYEKEFADTLGGTVQYDPHLLPYIDRTMKYERYALHDLDHDDVPELILLSEYAGSMNAIFTYTDKLVYCGTYYNALYTDDGKIIERGSWWAGSALIIDPWYITQIKAGEGIEQGSIWGEYLDHEESGKKYIKYVDEAVEISYEEYCDIKNGLLCNADFVRNIRSERIE